MSRHRNRRAIRRMASRPGGSDVVRFGILNETDRLDLGVILQESLAYAMHSVHDATIARKNDGEGKIAVQHQPRMVDNFAARQRSSALIGPVGFVQLTDRGQRDSLTNQKT